VIDPAACRDAIIDVALNDVCISALGRDLPSENAMVIDVDEEIVCRR
jgi:hypothetical protein